MKKTKTGWITDIGWRIDYDWPMGIIQGVKHVCEENDASIQCEMTATVIYVYACPHCHAEISTKEIVARVELGDV